MGLTHRPYGPLTYTPTPPRSRERSDPVANEVQADSDPVVNEVQVDLHMLRPLMLKGVGGEIHGADVVAVDERTLGERAVKLRQELS